MEIEAYPWREHRDLAKLLADARPVFETLRIVQPGKGCDPTEIDTAERRLGRPIPQDVRQFYLAMRPTQLFSKDGPKEFGFFQIDSKDFSWRSMAEAEPAEDWIHAEGLALGQSTSGDPFWWIRGHRSFPDGCTVLLDHEGSLGEDVMFVHFARTFPEFISKLVHFKTLYSQDTLYSREYAELNPSAEC